MLITCLQPEIARYWQKSELAYYSRLWRNNVFNLVVIKIGDLFMGACFVWVPFIHHICCWHCSHITRHSPLRRYEIIECIAMYFSQEQLSTLPDMRNFVL